MVTMADIEHVSSRADMTRVFDGYSFDRREEVDERRTKRPFVKTYLLEVLDGRPDHSLDHVPEVFRRYGIELRQVDTNLYGLSHANDFKGFLEVLRPRLVALYSVQHSTEIDKFVRHLVHAAPEIDHVWLSGRTFNVLWNVVTRLCQPHRYVRIVFTHDSVYDIDNHIDSGEDEDDEDEAISETEDASDDYEPIKERRAARFQLVDRIRVVQEKLKCLQDTYAPLHAISTLRFPSTVGRGGHDFYDNGKVTNRSDSFRDHRSHVLYVTRIYEQMLGRTESRVWYGPPCSTTPSTSSLSLEGAPLTVKFTEPLSPAVFDYWVKSTFGRQKNRFRLWGHPIRLGPTKVHVYGLDKHLWQPLFLELTAQGCVAIVPKGTCGNTVHRLVTNIQRYLDPSAAAYLGSEPYERLVQASSDGVTYDDTE